MNKSSQPLLKQDVKDEILERHFQAISKLKDKFLERKFYRGSDKDVGSRKNSATSQKSSTSDTSELTDKHEMVEFLEDFITLHYFLSGVVFWYPEIKVGPENVKKVIVKHVCKQLDAIVRKYESE